MKNFRELLNWHRFTIIFPNKTIMLIQELSRIIAQTLFNLKVNTRTENFLANLKNLQTPLKQMKKY